MNYLLVRFVSVATCTLAVSTSAQEVNMPDSRAFIPTERVAFPDPQFRSEPGNGWLTAGETTLTAPCVVADVQEQPYESQQSEFRRVSSKHTLDKTMGVSASASAKYYGASGNASYNMSSSLSLSEENIYIVGNNYQVVSSKIAVPKGKNPPQLTMSSMLPTSDDLATDINYEIHDVALSEDALALLKSNQRQFLKTCGDSYISSVVFGGVQSVAVILNTKTRSEFNSVSGSIGGGFDGGIVGGSASVTANSTVKKYSEQKKLTVLESRTGANPVASPITLEELEQRFRNFPTEVRTYLGGNQTPISVRLRRYDMLSNWPDDQAFPDAWGRGVRLLQQENALADLLRTIRAVRDNLTLYVTGEHINETALKEAESKAQAELDKVRGRRTNCAVRPADCDVSELWDDDLEVRSILPVMKEDMKEWGQLNKLEKAMNKLKAFKCEAYNNLLAPKDCRKQIQKKIKGLEPRLAAQREAVRIEAVNAAVNKWMKVPNDVRCEGAQAQWGCVNASVIEEYRDRLLKQETGKGLVPIAGLEFITLSEAPAIDITCQCKTKENPSWCNSSLGSFQELKYSRSSAVVPGDRWTEEFTAEYCRRHRDDGCLCEDAKYFSGEVTK